MTKSEMIMPKKILVLGANSFAGASYIKYMSTSDAQIVGISRSQLSTLSQLIIGDNSRADFQKIDLNLQMNKLFELMNTFKPEIIIDFAGQGMVAESWSNPNQWYTTNLLAKINILEFLKSKPWLKKYVKISTPEVYGSKDAPMREEINFNPSPPYAVSHAAIDMNLKIYSERYDFPAVIGRFANFYGGGQQLYRIIPKTILSILGETKFPLHGGGLSERSFIYGDDFSSGIQDLVSLGKIGEIYHFSSPEILSIIDLVRSICSQMGVRIENVVTLAEDRPSKDQKYLMDSSKAFSELGWSSNVNLEQGLGKTIDWFTSNFTNLREVPLEYVHRS